MLAALDPGAPVVLATRKGIGRRELGVVFAVRRSCMFPSLLPDCLLPIRDSLLPVARLKLKGIDGGSHKRWSMWLNSRLRVLGKTLSQT